MKSGRNRMKASVGKGGVPSLPVPGASWEVKIGCEQASSTEKRVVGTAKWLANPGGGTVSTKTVHFRHEQQIKWEIPADKFYKRKNMRRHPVSALCHILALGLAQNIMGQNAALPTTPSAGLTTAPIPIDQIGTLVSTPYSGDGLAVEFVPDGARLRCSFQKLNAQVTTGGLWLDSAADGAKGKPFRVIARTLGREDEEALPLAGKVEVSGQVARFIRMGLTEEYTV